MEENKENNSNSQMPQSNENDSGYFRSIDQWRESADFQKSWLHREFLPQASEATGVSRREFVKMMAGGLALMGLTGCRRPESHVIAMAEQPEGRVVGVPQYYTTSQIRGMEAIPLIAETHEGRPTKLEGNANYKPYNGSTDMAAQAYILDLYDADRATKHYVNGHSANRTAAIEALETEAKRLAQTAGEGTVVLAHGSTSPVELRAKREFLRAYPKAQWITYEAWAQDKMAIALQDIAKGKQLRPRYHLQYADVILALDCDLIGREIGAIHYAKEFSKRRRPQGSKDDTHGMNRLYVAESELTLTGGQADHRLRIADREIVTFAAALLAEVENLTGEKSGLHTELAKAPVSPEAKKWLQPMAADLVKHKGRSLVVCGAHQSISLQLITLALNDRLGAIGKTVELLEVPSTASDTAWSSLQSATHIIIYNANPSYDAPSSLQWAKVVAQKEKKTYLRYSYRYDETSLALDGATQILAAHGLESWGVGRAFDGTVVAQQPLIEPLFGGIEPTEWWARLCGQSMTTPRDIAEQIWVELTGKVKGSDFNEFLHKGVVEESGYVVYPMAQLPQGVWSDLRAQLPAAYALAQLKGTEIILRPSYGVGDGTDSNNNWQQECPDPITKLTWGNALLVSTAKAKELGYDPQSDSWLPVASRKLATLDRGRQTAHIATITVDGVQIKAPLAIQPGLADDTVLLHLGYGHTKYGRNADKIGVSAYPLLAGSIYSAQGVSIRLNPETVLLASTQNHWSLEGRDHYREGALEDYTANEKFAQKIGIIAHAPDPLGKDAAMPLAIRSKETPRGVSAFEQPNLTAPQQWGMSIDLSACNGCNACVVACQSENNIPTVGRDQILKGREMHWIRIDRYYATGNAQANKAGDLPSDVDVGVQPMLCQHCERAPCEQVCPVNATVHDEQGLNVMAYNRCVGTRYCANNCPYKVRRFNFFDYAKRDRDHLYWGMFGPEGMPEIAKLQKNPDVTVRSRGVMEKCTFCVQRIEGAKIRQRVIAKDSGNILVPDGVIKTACQQVCPTEAIVFGDVADETTQVSRLKHNPRDYSALEYLGTRPRLTYLARIKNQNPAMPDYHRVLRFRLEQGVDHAAAAAAHAGRHEHHDHDHDHDDHEPTQQNH